MRSIFAFSALFACALFPTTANSTYLDMNGADPTLAARQSAAPARVVQHAARPVAQKKAVPVATLDLAIGSGPAAPAAWLAGYLGGNPTGWRLVWCGRAIREALRATGFDDFPDGDVAPAWARYGVRAPAGALYSIRSDRRHVSIVVPGDCGPGRVNTLSGNSIGGRVAYNCETIAWANYNYPVAGSKQFYMQPDPYGPRGVWRGAR